MGEDDNTKASYSQMFTLRICYSVNEQKPFNSNLQEKYYDLLSVHIYFLPFKNLYKNKRHFFFKLPFIPVTVAQASLFHSCTLYLFR